MHLADLAAYSKSQDQVGAFYLDQKAWTSRRSLNVAHSGKFSSDRTIAQYASQIWEADTMSRRLMGALVMANHPLAGQPAPAERLDRLLGTRAAYHENRPDPADPRQRVTFGTSGHRGTSLDHTFTEAHILAITQAICDYRRETRDRRPSVHGQGHARPLRPAQRTALEVLAANGVETIIQRDDGVTPTPVISHAILVYNRGRTEHQGDGIVITPSHNPPADGGFKYNPPNGGPADTDVTRWIQDRANALLRAGNRRGQARPVRRRRSRATRPARSISSSPTSTTSRASSTWRRSAPRASSSASIRSAARRATTGSRSPTRYGLDITVTNPAVDPTFRFMTLDHDGKIRMDCSSPYAMASLVKLKDRFDVAFGNDPDSDRHGIVTGPRA